MLLTAVVVKGIGVEGGEVTPNTFHILLQMDSIYVVQKVGSGFVLVVTLKCNKKTLRPRCMGAFDRYILQ